MNTANGRIDRRILLVLLVATLVLRLLTLMMIHTGVDERDYWTAGQALVSDVAYPELQHRTVRWSLILPVAATQALLGSHPNIYYVAPLLVGLAQVVLVFRIGLRVSDRPTAFLASLGLVVFPYMIRGASQIRPGIFSFLYVLLALHFFVQYLEGAESRRGLVSLYLSALAMFLAYLTKVTNVYLIPGFLVAILLLRRRPKDALRFGALLFGLYLLETAGYAIVLGEPLGRLGIILGNHIGSGYIEPMPFWGVFRRYSPENLPFYWVAPLIVYPVAAVYLHRTRRSAPFDAVSLLIASFLVGITFAVTNVSPAVPVEAFLHRYFLAILGMLLLLDAAFVVDLWDRHLSPRLVRTAIARRFTGKSGPSSRSFDGGSVTVWPYLAAPTVVVLALAILFASDLLPRSLSRYYNDPLTPDHHPLSLNQEYRETIVAAASAGTPVIARPGVAGDNALKTATHFHLPRAMYAPGAPPEPKAGEVNGHEIHYLFSDPTAGRAAEQSLSRPVYLAERNPFRLLPMRLGDAVDAIQRPERVEVE